MTRKKEEMISTRYTWNDMKRKKLMRKDDMRETYGNLFLLTGQTQTHRLTIKANKNDTQARRVAKRTRNISFHISSRQTDGHDTNEEQLEQIYTCSKTRKWFYKEVMSCVHDTHIHIWVHRPTKKGKNFVSLFMLWDFPPNKTPQTDREFNEKSWSSPTANEDHHV
jgi:hypothetical protein